MKKIFFGFCVFLSIFFAKCAMCSEPVVSVAFEGISKIYIQYSNGEHQELTLTQEISYIAPVNDDEESFENGELVFATEGDLDQNSTVDRIAIYIRDLKINHQDGSSYIFNINGYLGTTPGSHFSPVVDFIGYSAPISSWFSVYWVVEGNDPQIVQGVVDFNSNVQFTETFFSISSGSPIDIKNKKVTIQLQLLGFYFFGTLRTENI